MLPACAALGEGNALQGGNSEPSASEGGASPIGVLEAAAGGQPLGGDPDDVSIPEKVEEILGGQPTPLPLSDTSSSQTQIVTCFAVLRTKFVKCSPLL